MGYKLNKSITVDILCQKLGLNYIGENTHIDNIAPANDALAGTLCFSKQSLLTHPNSILITSENIEDDNKGTFILSTNPRLDFIKALTYLVTEIGFDTYNFETKIPPNTTIGQNVVIEDGCIIGDNCIIEHNVVIQSGTVMGDNTRIRSGSCIGGDGFGFERLEDGTPLRFPHLGRVLIGSNVEIGANNTIARGTMSDTIISDNVKTDNQVHIAHNCFIGENALITAAAELSGGVKIGVNCWIGPNATLIQKITIGDGAFIGIGAVVTKNVAEYTLVAGNPAKIIKNLKTHEK